MVAWMPEGATLISVPSATLNLRMAIVIILLPLLPAAFPAVSEDSGPAEANMPSTAEAGQYALWRGNYRLAEEIWTCALNSGDVQSRARAATCLGGLLYRHGQPARAARILERAVRLSVKAFGADSRPTADALIALADAYREQEQLDRAEELYRKAVKTRLAVSGEKSYDTLEALDRLGDLCYKRQRYGEAEAIFSRCLKARESTSGVDELDLAGSMNSLAVAISRQGRCRSAEGLLRHAIASAERVLGPRHFLVASMIGNLAGICNDQNKFSEAELLYLKSMEINQSALGDSKTTARSAERLGAFYLQQGRYLSAMTAFLEGSRIGLICKISRRPYPPGF